MRFDLLNGFDLSCFKSRVSNLPKFYKKTCGEDTCFVCTYSGTIEQKDMYPGSPDTDEDFERNFDECFKMKFYINIV